MTSRKRSSNSGSPASSAEEGGEAITAALADDVLDDGALLDALRASVDPVFLPRRLRRVDALPRNETGKLPRAALDALLADPAD